MEDTNIVDLYLERDETAISCTAQKYGKRLGSIARNIVEDSGTSEECVNDTYLEAWNSIPPHEPRTYLFAFLGRITRHIALDFCRRRNASKRSANYCELTSEIENCIPGSSSADDLTDEVELAKCLDTFLAGLNREQQMIFVRRYWYFDSVADISSSMNLSQSKVKTTLFRLRENLRKHLEKGGFGL